ncbi:MAG TPA: hypothetical protein GXX75_16295 [Clostridiales bacterium]|nr:hypothetical protein [Clostridiales bacterium]
MAFRRKVEQGNEQVKDAKQLIQPYLQLVEEKEVCILGTLGTVNELLQFMTNLDYVKEMIQDANSQAEMIETVASSSEEMAATTEEISSYVHESNAKMQQATDEAGKSLNQVDKTFERIENNINEIDTVKGIMAEVTAETVKINELVNVIKAVADQTNLLSLNASIEAARAGEHGRGFAIVAGEIKKLAENTTEQVDVIRRIVEGLNEKIGKASGEIDRVVNTFSSSRAAIDEATGGIKGINVTMGNVEASFTSISANVEEQAATTQEMSAHLQIINEKSAKLRSEADRTGQAFFDISQKVDGIRLKALNCCSGKVDAGTMIELSITDHLMWKWRVYNMILGYIQLDVTAVGDHHGCRLGKWIATLDQTGSGIKNVIMKMEQPHSEVHKTAKKAIQEYNNGNKVSAEHLLLEIEKNSQMVVDALTELKKYI